MARLTRLVILICCYILSDESNIPFYFTSNGYKYLKAATHQKEVQDYNEIFCCSVPNT